MVSIIKGKSVVGAGISKGTITFKFDVRGLRKEELKLEYIQRRRGPNKVRIRGERFEQEIAFSEDLDAGDIHALFHNGFLTLKLVKNKTSNNTTARTSSSSSSNDDDEQVTEIKISEERGGGGIDTKHTVMIAEQILYDVVHREDADTLILALPSGLMKEQIKLQLLRKESLRILIFSHHSKWITLQKEFPLPPDCHKNSIKAKLGSDILYVIFPKKRNDPTTVKPAAVAASGETTGGLRKRRRNNEEEKVSTEVVGGDDDDEEIKARKLMKLRRQPPMKWLNVAAAVVALVVVGGVAMYHICQHHK
ncbi:unnamed protein product [Cuscuta campestris]|uniref:Uncharacterized protein n=1 Tax=Cuscuta campestris TaxID=132261 RepID=A0A484NNZ3_9ASTE|nr:unnamed protein product [Cuscuta campestris]